MVQATRCEGPGARWCLNSSHASKGRTWSSAAGCVAGLTAAEYEGLKAGTLKWWSSNLNRSPPPASRPPRIEVTVAGTRSPGARNRSGSTTRAPSAGATRAALCRRARRRGPPTSTARRGSRRANGPARGRGTPRPSPAGHRRTDEAFGETTAAELSRDEEPGDQHERGDRHAQPDPDEARASSRRHDGVRSARPQPPNLTIESGVRRWHRGFYARPRTFCASRNMSASTPAAVTSPPAPAPRTMSGYSR